MAIDLLLFGLLEPQNGGYDVAMLVSGDRDFVSVIEVLKQRRPACAVEVAQFTSSAGQELRDAARTFYPLEDYAYKFGNWIQKHSG